MVDSYSWELSGQLDVTVQSYEKDRQRYWENLGGWSDILYEQAERFAQAVLKNTEQLILAEEIDGDLSKLQIETKKSTKEFDKRIAGILDSALSSDKKTALICDVLKDYPPDPASQDSPLKLVTERFIIDLSRDAIDKIEEGASRIFQLYQLVLSSTPSDATQKFLGRLSRCYIWGYDPECVMLCRSVIDTAFNKKVTYKMCKKYPVERNKSPFSLENRIEVALKEELIDKDIAKKAHSVRLRGNTAVHKQPDGIKDVWGTICDTIAVLEKITRQN